MYVCVVYTTPPLLTFPRLLNKKKGGAISRRFPTSYVLFLWNLSLSFDLARSNMLGAGSWEPNVIHLVACMAWAQCLIKIRKGIPLHHNGFFIFYFASKILISLHFKSEMVEGGVRIAQGGVGG